MVPRWAAARNTRPVSSKWEVGIEAHALMTCIDASTESQLTTMMSRPDGRRILRQRNHMLRSTRFYLLLLSVPFLSWGFQCFVPSLSKKQQTRHTRLYGYKFGDLSKGLAKKAASAINEMTGKEHYEFGDLSRHLDKLAKSRVNEITEKDEYQFGDLSKWTESQVKLKLTNFTGKVDYQVGDITKEIIRRVQTGEYELQDVLFLCKVLMTFGVGLAPVASFLPAKLLLEMVQFSVMEETSGRLLNALSTTLDQRFKETLTGDPNYKLGDKTKEVIQNILQKSQEQVTENVSKNNVDKELDAALIDELDDWDRRLGITVKDMDSSR